MSREIKFRAWYQPDKDMGEVVELCEYTVKVRYKGNVIQDWVRPDFKLMQYTGLKDKNGKEIYEGDIVVDKYTKITNCEVVFERGGFKYVGSPRGTLALSYLVDEGTEVIGNVYQDKHLLEENE